MFPVLTRIFWLLAQPVSVGVLLLIAGWLLSLRAKRGWSRTVLGLGILISSSRASRRSATR